MHLFISQRLGSAITAVVERERSKETLPAYFATAFSGKPWREGSWNRELQRDLGLPVLHVFLCSTYSSNLSLSQFLGLF